MSRNLLQLVLRHADGLTAAEAADGDAHLLRRFVASRDEAAFAALVKRHGPMVWAVCRQSVPHHADAEDAFQATFLALAQSAGKVRAPERLAGWLHAAAVRIAAKAKRSFSRRRTHERATARGETDSPVSAAAWGELQAAVHAEVASLPPSLRAAFVLCDLEGVEVGAAAGRLGVKANTLSGQLARARQRLMAGLARRGVAAGAVAFAAAVAVPDGLAKAVAGGVVPTPAVLELAAEVTTMGVSKLKLLAAGLLLAGGLSLSGLGLLQRADGQTPAPPGGGGAPPSSGGFPGAGGPPPGGAGGSSAGPGGPGVPGTTPGLPRYGGGSADGGEGGGSMMPGAPKGGEYLFAAKPGTVADVAKLLRAKGDQGWEYTGPLDVDPADPPKGKEFEGVTKDTRVVLVFKRRPAPILYGGGGMGGGGGMAGGGMTGGGGGARFGGGGGEEGGGGVAGSQVGMTYKLKHAHATADLVGQIRTKYADARGQKTSAGLAISADARTNSLNFSGSQATIDLVLGILETLDVKPSGDAPTSPTGPLRSLTGGDGPTTPAEQETVTVFRLRNVAAAEVAETLGKVFGTKLRVVPEPSINALIVISSNKAAVEEARTLLSLVEDASEKKPIPPTKK